MTIWFLDQSANDVPPGNDWLGGAELSALARFTIPKRRADWRLGRWTAKAAISRLLKLPQSAGALAEIEVRPAPSGAPEVFLHGRRAPVNISTSHSHGMGFCSVADCGIDVGCDVERVLPCMASRLSDYFTEAEQDVIRGIAEGDRDSAATLLWSAKESAFKLLRCGLRSDPRALSVQPRMPFYRSAAWSRFAIEPDLGGTQGWWREAGGFVWAVLASHPSGA